MPGLVYSHSLGCAVVAGPIYRGSLIPELRGMIVYADYCAGLVRAFSISDDQVLRHVTLFEPGTYGPILSLVIDQNDEILLLTELGEIRRLGPQSNSPDVVVDPDWSSAADASQGWLWVTNNPALPATISIDGTPSGVWGVFTDLEPGDHEVCFGDVTGYTTPACQTVTITPGDTIQVTGTFIRAGG